MSAIGGRAPVFLQTGFRTGGTWLWSRFRANCQTLCFCEPLNEALERLTPHMIADLTPETSNLNHPTLATPYFHEFLPLLNDTGTGIMGYRAEFGLNSYFAASAEQPAGLAEYLQHLLDLATDQGRQAVLKFTRAFARADWLRHRLPEASQIALIRNPCSQFQSACSLARNHDNYTFLMIPLFMASRPRHGALKILCENLKIASVPLSHGIEKCADTYTRLARQMSESDLFSVFLGTGVAAHARSAPFFDLVIDQELLADCSSYRNNVELSLEVMTGLKLDLSGCGALPVHELGQSSFDVRAACESVYKIMGGEYPHSVEYMRQRIQHLQQAKWG